MRPVETGPDCQLVRRRVTYSGPDTSTGVTGTVAESNFARSPVTPGKHSDLRKRGAGDSGAGDGNRTRTISLGIRPISAPDTRGIAAAGGYPGAARTERHPEHPRAVGDRELLLPSGSIPDRRSPCPGQRCLTILNGEGYRGVEVKPGAGEEPVEQAGPPCCLR
jgi:hypothetical protein